MIRTGHRATKREERTRNATRMNILKECSRENKGEVIKTNNRDRNTNRKWIQRSRYRSGKRNVHRCEENTAGKR